MSRIVFEVKVNGVEITADDLSVITLIGGDSISIFDHASDHVLTCIFLTREQHEQREKDRQMGVFRKWAGSAWARIWKGRPAAPARHDIRDESEGDWPEEIDL